MKKVFLLFIACISGSGLIAQDLGPVTWDNREGSFVSPNEIEQTLPDADAFPCSSCMIKGNNKICFNKTTTFVGTQGMAGIAGGYIWKDPNGATISSGNPDRIVIKVEGLYSLSIPGGCPGQTFCTKYLTVDQSAGCADEPPCCPPDPQGVNAFDSYSGNVHREIRDLEVWGGIGDPLVWMRYGNSRNNDFGSGFGNAHNWGNSYRYSMVDDGAQITIHYPEGGQDNFVQNSATLWLPVAGGVDKRLFQSGADFYLQRANGYRFHFQKISGSYQLLDYTDTYQNLYKLFYNTDKTLDSITEPAGRYLKINYSTVMGTKVISKVSTKDGRSVQYIYDSVLEGSNKWVRLRRVAYGDGTNARYDYSQVAAGEKPNLQKAIDPRVDGPATIMQYTYDTSGVIKEERNGKTGNVMATLTTNGDTKTVCYSNGRTQTLVQPASMPGNTSIYIDGAGAERRYTYLDGGKGFLNSSTDALGRITTYNQRTVYGNPLEITYPDGSKEKWTRDAFDRILTHTDELNRVTTYTRDANGRVTRIDNPDGTFETFTYNSFGQVLDHRRRNGGVEHSVYGTTGLQTSFADALNNTTNYTYDGASRLAAVTNARGNTRQYEYNERGLMTKEINADLSFKQYRYDSLGNRDTVINELGNKWITRYDEFRRADSLIDPLDRLTQYKYDLPGGVCGCSHDNDKLTKIILPSGKTAEIGYDLEWRKIRETAGLGTVDEASTFYEYDAVGNTVTVIDPKGKRWTTQYDLRDRKKSSSDPLGNIVQWTYDEGGNVLSEIRPDNGSTINHYDNMSRVTQSTDPKLQLMKWTYDAEGNILKITDTKNNDYNFEYDLLNRRIKMIYSGGSFEEYTYDVAGNLATYTNRAGNIKTYTYDNRNRETNSSWNVSTPSVALAYDAADKLTSMSSSVSSLTYSYNTANEMTSETQAVAGNLSKIVGYSYNADGFKNSLTYPGGTVVSYVYTSRNQIASISVNGTTPLVGYTYDLNSSRASKTLNNGTVVTYSYDDANRQITIDNKKGTVSFARFDYGYNNVNLRKFVKRDNDKGDVYTYDAVDQVTDVSYEVTTPEGSPSNPLRFVNYDLDAAGNRLSVTDNFRVNNYAVNNLNQYTSVGGISSTYTSNGSLGTFDGWTYTYDAQNRLIKAEKGNSVMDFAYDARNRCVKRTINGTTTFFYYDTWNLIEEKDGGDVQLARYVNGSASDEILTKVSPLSTAFYYQDALGSVTHLTNLAGDLLEQYKYDAFGKVTIKDAAGMAIPISGLNNRFMFTGREYFKEIKLYDYRNRLYSDSVGRFLQTDPKGFEGKDLNLYRYVYNSPINGIDPQGEKRVLAQELYTAKWTHRYSSDDRNQSNVTPSLPELPISPPPGSGFFLGRIGQAAAGGVATAASIYQNVAKWFNIGDLIRAMEYRAKAEVQSVGLKKISEIFVDIPDDWELYQVTPIEELGATTDYLGFSIGLGGYKTNYEVRGDRTLRIVYSYKCKK